MTYKKKFTVEDPEVVVTRNGKYQYRVPCPWDGKNGKKLVACKWASVDAYRQYVERKKAEAEVEEAEIEQELEDTKSEVS